MAVTLEMINEDYRQRVCKGIIHGLQDRMVDIELVKRTKGWRKLPDGAVAVDERIYIPRDEGLQQEIIREHHDS